MRRSSIPIAFLLVEIPAVSVAAETPWHLETEALTDVPVQVGARAALEGPFGLRLGTALGVLPGPYVDLINEVATGAGWYDEETAELIRSSLENSLVWRLHAGWRPFSDFGFYVDLGYSLVALGGAVSNEDLLALSAGQSPPTSESGSGRHYDVSSTLHLLDLELGWKWVLGDAWVVRTAVGFAATVAAQTEVKPSYRPLAKALVDRFARGCADYLDDIYTSYVMTGTITVAVGYQFF